MECFSIECRKTKPRVIATANQNKDKYQKEPMRTQSKYAGNRPQARENATDQVANDFSFVSDWLSKWHEFSRPITERSKEKPITDYFRHSIENCSK